MFGQNGTLSTTAQERDPLAPEIESPAAEQDQNENDEKDGVDVHWVNSCMRLFLSGE
jgi:hypothetical protein